MVGVREKTTSKTYAHLGVFLMFARARSRYIITPVARGSGFVMHASCSPKERNVAREATGSENKSAMGGIATADIKRKKGKRRKSERRKD